MLQISSVVTMCSHSRNGKGPLHNDPQERSNILLGAYKVFKFQTRFLAEYCHLLLGNSTLIKELKEQERDSSTEEKLLIHKDGLLQNFTISIAELWCNKCFLALADHLGVPVIGYWHAV